MNKRFKKIFLKRKIRKRKKKNPTLYIKVLSGKEFIDVSSMLKHKFLPTAELIHLDSLEMKIPVYISVGLLHAINHNGFINKHGAKFISYKQFKKIFTI